MNNSLATVKNTVLNKVNTIAKNGYTEMLNSFFESQAEKLTKTALNDIINELANELAIEKIKAIRELDDTKYEVHALILENYSTQTDLDFWKSSFIELSQETNKLLNLIEANKNV